MIIARYLVKDIAQSFLAVGLVLLAIGISAQLVGLFAEVTSGTLGVDTVMILLGLKTLKMLIVVIPLSLYLGILMSLGKFYQNNEMAAMLACGITPGRVFRSVLGLAILVSLIVATLSVHLVPWSEGLSHRISQEAENRADMEGMSAGRFREISSGVGVIYAEAINRDTRHLQGVFMQMQDRHGETIMRSTQAYQKIDSESGDRFMVFENGMRFDGRPGSDGYAMIEFEKHGVRLREKNQLPQYKKYTAVPINELLVSDRPVYIAEWQWRFSSALMTLLLAILAIPLSKTSPRQGRYARLALALLFYILISNLLNVARVKLSLGDISPLLGLWWVHLTVLLLIIFLFMQQTGFRYLAGRLQKT